MISILPLRDTDLLSLGAYVPSEQRLACSSRQLLVPSVQDCFVHGRRTAQNDCDGRKAWCVRTFVTLSVEKVIYLRALRKVLNETLSRQVRCESRLTMESLRSY